MHSGNWKKLALVLVFVTCGKPTETERATRASHGDVSLPGSDFEIDTDANLKLDHTGDAGPSIDWASVSHVGMSPPERRKTDLASGSGDDSFGQGAKEDTEVPAKVSGSIPPNKSDLLTFGVFLEEAAVTTDGGLLNKKFLHLFWHRVQEPTGTTNMDFEFNQSSMISGNGVTPVRTCGDLLIQYDLAQGGVNPQLFISRWIQDSACLAGFPASFGVTECEAANNFPCWSNKVNLTAAGDATGSINTSAIPPADSDGLAVDIDGDGTTDPISPRTFGEASIDFDAIVGGGTCVAFGSAYLKSRSSDSFTSALKDFIAPQTLNISNCGSVEVIKENDLGTRLPGAVFKLIKDFAPINNMGGPGPEDTGTNEVIVGMCTTPMSGVCLFTNVFQGDYWVVETVAPEGTNLASPPYQHVTVVADEKVSVTFVNPRQRGAILVTKTRKHAALGAGDHPHVGVDFTVNGLTKTTDANGKACFDGLLFGDYTVTETVPANYSGEDPKTVTVDNAASCTDNPYVGETVSFHNEPLTTISVAVDSLVDGGTNSTITCTGPSTNQTLTTPLSGDGTLTLSSKGIGTYTCTIVVDP